MLGSNFRLLCQLPNPISRCPLSFLEPQVWAVLLSTEGNHPGRRAVPYAPPGGGFIPHSQDRPAEEALLLKSPRLLPPRFHKPPWLELLVLGAIHKVILLVWR